jgi:hypothetical protein
LRIRNVPYSSLSLASRDRLVLNKEGREDNDGQREEGGRRVRKFGESEGGRRAKGMPKFGEGEQKKEKSGEG